MSLVLLCVVATLAAHDVKRVINGTIASLAQFPAAAALLRRNVTDASAAFICSGVVIDARWVLTAQHCCLGKTAASLDVLVGSAMLSRGGQRIAVDRVLTPGKFTYDIGVNDICLLNLGTPMVNAPIVQLGVAGRDGDALMMVGFGRSVQNVSTPSDSLKVTTAAVRDMTFCGGESLFNASLAVSNGSLVCVEVIRVLHT